MQLREIKIDPEFRDRLRRQTPDEAAAMKKSIDERGYLTPLIVWLGQGVLIDGHNRYADWQARHTQWKKDLAEYEKSKPGIVGTAFGKTNPKSPPPSPPSPDFIQMAFGDREAVLAFIDELQYSKRNLTESEMAIVRARWINRAKATMPKGEAVKASAERFDTSESTAWRDAKLGESLETIDPIVKEKTGQSIEQHMAKNKALTTTDIHEAAAEAPGNSDEAVTLVERKAADKRCKPRTDGPQASKGPTWERHMASLTKALVALKAIESMIDDSVDEERTAAIANLKELVKVANAITKALKALSV